MLKDSVRTDAYRNFIYDNKNLFKDKIVLDVGCGTGILSLFAAKAGAVKVIAVDESDIIQKARANVFENGLEDTIQCLHGTIETLTLPVQKVDIIISEWMGYALLFEAMLPSVLYARDRYLKTDGLMVPSHTTLRVGQYVDPDYITDHILFWQDVYGFKMSAMLEGVYDEAIIMQVPKSSVSGPGQTFWMADLHTVTVEDLQFRANPFSLVIKDPIDRIDGFVVWFDAFFATDRHTPLHHGVEAKNWVAQGRVAFSTGPDATRTHWQQAVLLIDPKHDPSPRTETRAASIHPDSDDTNSEPAVGNRPETIQQTMQTNVGNSIHGDISFTPTEEDKRALNIRIRWSLDQDQPQHEQKWALV